MDAERNSQAEPSRESSASSSAPAADSRPSGGRIADSALLAALIGLLAVVFGLFYSDIQNIKTDINRFNADIGVQKEKSSNESDNLKRNLNVWAGEEFGSMCSLFGGTYNFNSKECSYVRQTEDGKKRTEAIVYKAPFPDLHP